MRRRRRGGRRRRSRPERRAASRTVRPKASARLSRMQRTSATRLAGAGWSSRAQRAAIRAGMSPGGRKDGVVRVDDRTACRELPRGGEQRRQILGRAFELPGPERLLEQPQPHHVAQVADATVDAALVREVRRAALLGQDGSVELDADQRPRPAGDVGERDVAGGHPDDRRRGVVRPDERQDRLGREAGPSPDVVAQRADRRRPVRRAAANSDAGIAERLDQVGVPRPRDGRRAAPSSRRW